MYKALRNGVQEVAVKLLTRGGDEIVMRELRREIAILRAVSADANIVQVQGTDERHSAWQTVCIE